MTFAEINFLSISIDLLLVVFVIVCLLMTLIILMQRPKQEGLGAAFGAGVTDQVFGARTTGVLQKGTVYLGSAFFILSLALAILIGKQNQAKSLVVPAKPKTEAVKPAEPAAPAAPAAPATPETTAPVEPAPAAPAPEYSTPAPAPSTPDVTAPAPAEPAPASPQKTEGQ